MSDQDLHPPVDDRAIAVIGMAGRFPSAPNLDAFWDNLKHGRDGVTFFADEELIAAGVAQDRLCDPSYVKAGMLLDGVDGFDAAFFGYTPHEAEIMDPQQRLFLEHVWAALEHAGYTPKTYQGLIGVYAGVAWNTYLLSNLCAHPELFAGSDAFQVFITNDKDFMPTRVSYKLNLKGPSLIIQTSCSTSLVAIHLACLSLLDYECDMALAGGVTVKVPQRAGYFYQEGGLASPDGHCRAFDANAQGTIFGSGVGVVVLKRLGDALADGDTLYAVIKGSAINNDGALKVSYTAPSVDGQAEVIAAAQAVARISPESISYIEAHGTATALGDPIEIAALTKVFRAGTTKKQFCAIGSVKSNLGHLDAAAGVAGFIKTVLALRHRQIPPSLYFEQPNPKIDFANSPFYVNTALKRWDAAGMPLRAGVSSFGVGGTNAHIILEEAPAVNSDEAARPWQLLVLSARSAAALEVAIHNLAVALEATPDLKLADVAYTLQLGRAAFRHRCMLVCQTRAEAIEALTGRAVGCLLSAAESQDLRARPIVFMFPGQGAQYVQMGRQLYEQEPVFREYVDYCCDLLIPKLGLDLRDVLYPDQEGTGVMGQGIERQGNRVPGSATPPQSSVLDLDQTWLAQPTLFIVEYALAQLWMSYGIYPQALIGHSVGEYVAACLAGVLTLEDALMLIAVRGQLMQALPPGAMIAVPLAEAELQPLLSAQLAVAAINELERCVVSGSEDAIALLETRLAEQAITCRRLHTSHAFHSPMMDSIVQPFVDCIKAIHLHPPQIPYISNLTGTWVSAAEVTDPCYWGAHLRQTVHFATGVATLLEESDRLLLEVGPGNSLSTLARHHPAHPVVLSTLRRPDESRLDSAVFLEALGRLWLAGLDYDWSHIHQGEHRLRVPLPTYPFEHQRYWIEPMVSLEAAPRVPVAARKKAHVTDWLFMPSWKRTAAPTRRRMAAPERWLLFADALDLWRELAQQLDRAGHEVYIVTRGGQFSKTNARGYTIDPQRRDDYDALFQDLYFLNRMPAMIVHLWSVTHVAASTLDAFEQAQHDGCYSLLFIAQALGRLNVTEPLCIATISNNMQYVAGEPARAPEKASLLGPCKVIPQEYPNISCRSIDIVLTDGLARDRLASALITEIAAARADPVVAYRDNKRWVQIFEPIMADSHDRDGIALREGGVYLITGGLEGLGYALAEELARTCRASLALIAPSPVDPDDEPAVSGSNETEKGDGCAQQHVRTLEAHGAAVLVISADIADADQMCAAIAQTVGHFGVLHGVIHAAGPAGEQIFRSIQETSYEECGWHFGPRAYGTLALEQALRGHELDFCMLASSLAAVLGGLGYAAYAAASAFLDAYAAAHNAAGSVPWISINWDAWQLPDDHEQVMALSADLAQFAMTMTEAGAAFRRAITLGPVDQVVISTTDLQPRIDRWLQPSEQAHDQALVRQAGHVALHPRPNLPTTYVAPETELEWKIAPIWQRLLGIEQIGIHDNFFELGGDSFIAIRVASQLKKELNLEVPAISLYEGMTIHALAQLIERRSQPATSRAAELEQRKEKFNRRKQYQMNKRAAKPGR